MNKNDQNQNPEAEASVYIDRSIQALKERLELCMLRTDAFTSDAVAPELKNFFGYAFALLQETAGKQTSDGGKSGEELCKPAEFETNELCKPIIRGSKELCKLTDFWLRELKGLVPLEKGGSLTDLVISWETTLQLLLEAEMAFEEKQLPGEKEWKDILYSYIYDYAGDLFAEAKERSDAGKEVGKLFIPELAGRLSEKREEKEFMASCPEQICLGLELFLGDRLKARLAELLSAENNREGRCLSCQGRCLTRQGTSLCAQGTSLPVENTGEGTSLPGEMKLSAHQRKTLAELLRKTGTLAVLCLLVLALAACGGKEREKETEEETTAAKTLEYPGMVSYKDPDSSTTDYFGIMHATILDVQAGEKDGLFVYTLRDEEDPDNAWCLNSQNVGSIFCDVDSGKRVAVLFSGDMAEDPDHVEFIAIVDDAAYQIKSVEGTTVQNMMNSFVVRSTKGTDLTFVKDNCKVDKDALSTDGSARILVYYAGCNSGDLYPVRVYKKTVNER